MGLNKEKVSQLWLDYFGDLDEKTQEQLFEQINKINKLVGLKLEGGDENGKV